MCARAAHTHAPSHIFPLLIIKRASAGTLGNPSGVWTAVVVGGVPWPRSVSKTLDILSIPLGCNFCVDLILPFDFIRKPSEPLGNPPGTPLKSWRNPLGCMRVRPRSLSLQIVWGTALPSRCCLVGLIDACEFHIVHNVRCLFPTFCLALPVCPFARPIVRW